MIRVGPDAVYLPAYCIEQSTRAPGDGEATSGGCLPRLVGAARGRRRHSEPPPPGDDDGAAASSSSSIPASRLVGAERDARGRVRVWYTEPEEEEQATHGGDRRAPLRGYVCPPPLRVRVSAPADASAAAGGGAGTGAADALVEAVRALARTGNSSASRVVAIVNPASGRGRALRDFERDVRPLLERAAGLAVMLSPTRCAGHARELVRALEVGSGDVVLAVVGGDGTLHEVINGLLSRPDWREVLGYGGVENGPGSSSSSSREEAAASEGGRRRTQRRRLLLAHVPCGSGNGVAVSCGLRDAATAAVAIAKGCRARLDVTSVLVRTAGGRPPTMAAAEEAGGGGAGGAGGGAAAAAAAAASASASAPLRLTRTFCALSIVYGMMANLDVRTEPLRFLGDARFTLGGALEILGAQSYALRGAWAAPAPALAVGGAAGFLGEEDVGKGDGDEEEEEQEEDGGYRPPQAAPAAGGGALLAVGRARSCDLLAAAAAAEEDDRRGQAAPAAANGDELLGDGGPPLPLLARLLRETGGASGDAGGGANGLPNRIPGRARLLRAAGWRSLPVGGTSGGGGGVHMYAAVGPPYVAGNYRFNPLGALSTGALRQMWVPGRSVRGVEGRLASLQLQDAAAEGRHLGAGAAGLMRHAPAAALVLEPRARPGQTWLQLDGEVVRGAAAGAALWAEVHAGLLGVAVRPGHPEAD